MPSGPVPNDPQALSPALAPAPGPPTPNNAVRPAFRPPDSILFPPGS